MAREFFTEKYNKIKKLENVFVESMMNSVVSMFKSVWLKPIVIGNMAYYYTEHNGVDVPAYCYLSDYERGDIDWLPIYDEANEHYYGWSDLESVTKILDAINDKFYKDLEEIGYGLQQIK